MDVAGTGTGTGAQPKARTRGGTEVWPQDETTDTAAGVRDSTAVDNLDEAARPPRGPETGAGAGPAWSETAA
ncbi:hypothetical protein SGFS_029150 [Streptomyces graminofaciens]|uniref:Uncharacterized protein n=1 Tax=Streptomyces graminofaciens TaxID=68212 RepID=A0ABN5VF09_9ACTN|nr:hypothetical protein SGFS_029150 [Streptomyces graminofaciens]